MRHKPSKISSAPEGNQNTDEELLPTEEVAKMWGVSRVTVDRDRLAGRLTAVRQKYGYAFRRSEVLEVGRARQEPKSAITKEMLDGERDARIFAAFQDGCSIDETVIREEVAVSIVSRLRIAWDQARTHARNSAACFHRGGSPCRGAPKHVLCDAHAARSRVLSSEEILMLRGQAVPKGLHCRGCDELTDKGMCARCLAAIQLSVEGEGSARRFVIRAHGQALLFLSEAQSNSLAQQFSAKVESKLDASDTTHPLPQGKELEGLLSSLRLTMEAQK